ncbi:MAG TPA: hypothetical protein VFF47_05315 [Nitrospirota bacterium]|nr:hypothetical protein [Nitrospirota bacterium]
MTDETINYAVVLRHYLKGIYDGVIAIGAMVFLARDLDGEDVVIRGKTTPSRIKGTPY